MLRLLANEQVKDLPGDIRSFVRTHGEGSLSATKLFVERTPKNPLCKKAALPPPLVFVFHGPDKKYKGVGAQSRNRLVAQVAEGTSSVYETPLCSGEQAAWETLGIFRSNLFENGAEEIAEENADTRRHLSRVKKELCVVSYEYGGYLPVGELAKAVTALPEPVRLLLHRTSVLVAPERSNRDDFERLLDNVCRLHLRGCRHLNGLCEGVARSRALTVLSVAYCLLEEPVSQHGCNQQHKGDPANGARLPLLQELMLALQAAGILQSLTLQSCLMSAKLLPHVLEASRTIPSLTQLDVTGNKLSDAGVSMLCQLTLPHAVALKTLVLDDNSISDAGATALGHSLRQYRQTSLEYLSLANNTVQSAGTQYIASALNSNSTLLALNLSANWVGDEGMKMLSQALTRNTSLLALQLAANGLTDASTGIHVEAANMRHDLDGTNLRAADGAMAQAGMTLSQALQLNASLRELDLDQNAISSAGAEAVLAAIKTCNQGLTRLAIASNTHFFRRDHGKQPQPKRRFGSRILAERNRLTAEQEEALQKARMAEAEARFERELALPPGLSMAEGERQLEALFVKYSAAGKGLGGMGKRSASMDFGELLMLLAHLRVVPAAKGGCGHMTKTHVSAIFQSVNKRKAILPAGDAGGVMRTSSSGAASGDQDANELDLQEFVVLLEAIAKYLGKKHRVQLLCLEPATTAPTAPSTMDDEHKTGPAIAVRQKTFIRHKDKRLEPKAPKEPQSVEELFVKFSAGDSAAQGKRASTMDLNEFIKTLIYLGLLPAKGAAEGKLSKTEATALFKRAQKGAADAREMDGAAFRVVLRLVAEKCGLALAEEAEGDEQLAVLLPAQKDKPPVSRAARKLTCLKHLSSVGQPQTGQTGNKRGEEVPKQDIAVH